MRFLSPTKPGEGYRADEMVEIDWLDASSCVGVKIIAVLSCYCMFSDFGGQTLGGLFQMKSKRIC